MNGTTFPRLAVLIVAFVTPPLSAQVKITYLANEGVQIEAAGAKVLVDALFRDSRAPG